MTKRRMTPPKTNKATAATRGGTARKHPKTRAASKDAQKIAHPAKPSMKMQAALPLAPRPTLN